MKNPSFLTEVELARLELTVERRGLFCELSIFTQITNIIIFKATNIFNGVAPDLIKYPSFPLSVFVFYYHCYFAHRSIILKRRSDLQVEEAGEGGGEGGGRVDLG